MYVSMWTQPAKRFMLTSNQHITASILHSQQLLKPHLLRNLLTKALRDVDHVHKNRTLIPIELEAKTKQSKCPSLIHFMPFKKKKVKENGPVPCQAMQVLARDDSELSTTHCLGRMPAKQMEQLVKYL